MLARDKLLRKYISTNDCQNKQVLWQKYKQLRNSISSQLNVNKSKYYSKYFEENKSNITNIWKGIKDLVTIKNNHSNTKFSLYHNNELKTDPTEVANIFNDFFVKIGPKLASKIPNTNRNFSHLNSTKNLNSIYLKPTDEDEVKKIISSLDSKKSIGPNSIPIIILKQHKDILSIPISILINQSFEKGVFPDICKIAKVIPIYKKGDETISSNYRPISLLPIFSKIFEKCMYTRIYSFLTKFNLIYEKQFGFRKHYSTNHAFSSLIETIKNYLDSGNFVCGIFIDLQKAFDTVDHKILLNKLWSYGIRGNANAWLKSFLINRKQFVSINGFTSESKLIECGVPQGSTLGPLLFLIYLNDMNKIFQNLIVHHFADDTNLIFASKKLKTIENIVNFELKLLVEWLKRNKLSLNESKTEVIIFHHQNKNIENISIKLNKIKLKIVKNVKYLGVNIDETLSWNKQIEDVKLKISKANGILSKLRHYVPQKICLSIYYSLFYSYLSYCCLAWSFSSKTNLENIFKLQKKCLRIITFSDFNAHTEPIFKSLEILKLEDIIYSEILRIMLEVKENRAPDCIAKLFSNNTSVHSHFTRLKNYHTFHIPNTNTSQYGLMSLKFKGASIWNDFIGNNPSLNNISSRNLFTKKVKSILLNKYLEHI